MTDKFLWVERYAPHTIEECILPKQIKDNFLAYAKDKEFPNLILAGPAGVGKTSVSKALCDEIDTDMLFVNASLDRGIGDIRTTVAQFASTTSLVSKKKVVLLDEADNLTADSQKALRALIEEFQNHCRFILTCNYPHNIIDAIHSRCTVFDFNVRDEKEVKKLSAEFYKKATKILNDNQIKFNDKILAKYIMAMAPDWRGMLNGMQGNSKTGELSPNILIDTPDTLVQLLKDKKWTDIRDWVFKNSYIHPRQLERTTFKAIQDAAKNECKPIVSMIYGEYSHRIGMGADPSITLLNIMTIIMVGSPEFGVVEFK
jgi:DNA polymerase III delta prime subunit